MRKLAVTLAIVIPVACLLGVLLYNLPPVQARLGWRVEALWADVKYAIKPPEKQVFVPAPTRTASATLIPLFSPTPTIALTTPEPATTPISTFTPTMVPTPLPEKAVLSGIAHMYQTWNNCGPANLAMALSFWGWKGNQSDTAAVLKPNNRDKNVMPYEMEAYVEEHTDLQAVVRTGGELDVVKAFLSSDFPVLVETGFEGANFDGWMGHYQVVSGYDDARQVFYVQDSYKGPNQAIAYEKFQRDWRAFNFTYLVIYPFERRQQMLDVLGLQAYDNFNNHYSAQKALEDTATLSGRDLYFAWFNRGSSLVALKDYANAAQAYDTAFANYAQIPEAERPWRMMWYQTSPYWAYYYTGRYQDVINLATQTLDAMSEPVLEETFYWRAQAQLALGQNEAAIQDLQQCLVAHEEFQPCVDGLKGLGLDP
ncbi:MAG: C39 family peptidase [Chloroflexota bacterium]